MIARTVDAGDNFKKRASIPLAPCIVVETGGDDHVQGKYLSKTKIYVINKVR
jgi:hypothetical protein